MLSVDIKAISGKAAVSGGAINETVLAKRLSFCLAVVIFFITQAWMGVHDFKGDARLYWALSSNILELNFPQTVRGYFYPLLLSPFRAVFDLNASIGLAFLNFGQSLCYGYVFSILLPNVFVYVFGGALTLIRRLLPVVLIAIVFPGVVSFPLSDAPSFCLIVCALACFIRGCEAKSLGGMLAFVLASGGIAYFSYNTRPIYIFSMVVLVFCILFLVPRGRCVRVALSAVFVVGAFFAAAPQMAINYKYYKAPSPFVVTDLNGGSLFVSQMAWGMVVDKYETYMEPMKDHGTPVFYANSKGVEILRSRGGVGSIASYSDIWGVMRAYPLFFAELYLRHIATGLDARDGDVYTTQPSYAKDLRSFLYFFLLSMGLVQLGVSIFSEGFTAVCYVRILLSVVLIIPSIAIVPGAIESRFFFAVYCLAYCALAMLAVRENRWGMQVCFALCLTLSVFLFTQSMSKHPIYQRPESYVLETQSP